MLEQPLLPAGSAITRWYKSTCVNQNVTAEPMSLWVELMTKYALLKRYWRTSNIARSLSSMTPRRNGSSSVEPSVSLNPQQPLLQGWRTPSSRRWVGGTAHISTPKDQLASVAKVLTKPHRIYCSGPVIVSTSWGSQQI